MRFWMAGALGLVLVGKIVLAQELIPLGGQFQVNSFTPGDQDQGQVATDAQGNFVVVWSSAGSSGSDMDRSIQAQRYDADGAAVGDQFQVNSYTTNWQWAPALAADAEGNFGVVWQSDGSYGTDSSDKSIQAQFYDASGTPVGSQFQINSYTTGAQWVPDLAWAPQGDFVVVWASDGSYGTDTDSLSIQAQLYDANATPVGNQFQVNSYTTDDQWGPEVAVGAAGNFVVVWGSGGSSGTDTSGWSVLGQRYDASGTPIGGQFQVNSYTTGSQLGAAVAADAEGNFVVVWQSHGSYGTDTSSASVQGQRYDASGTPVGSQFQINSYTTGGQADSEVSVDAQGNFVVVWESVGSYGTDNLGYSIQGQRYDASGAAVGDEFQINSYTTGAQWVPSVASEPQGDFVVVWASDGSYGTDGLGYSIQGQRFASPIFVDGFESGDTSAWSSTKP